VGVDFVKGIKGGCIWGCVADVDAGSDGEVKDIVVTVGLSLATEKLSLVTGKLSLEMAPVSSGFTQCDVVFSFSKNWDKKENQMKYLL